MSMDNKEASLTLEPDPMQALPLPSVERARDILRELDWGEHFIGIEMNPAAGNSDIYIYSLREASQFLHQGTAGMGLSTGGKGSISWFNVESFVEWIKNSVHDSDLAQAIELGTASEENFHDKIQKLTPLLNIRLAQLTELVATKD